LTVDRLGAYRDGRLLGILDRGLTFAYDPRVIEEQSGEILISASLRVRERPFGEREARPFFEGLLPEGLARQRLAARFRLADDDTFGLLAEIGRDCAGALSMVPEGEDPHSSSGEPVIWLDDDALAKIVADLDVRPLGVYPERDIRLSLAGAQDKLVVVVDQGSGRIGLPRGTTPSTHILKPAPKERFPGLVLNEAYCSVLAAKAGLSSVNVQLIKIDEAPALLIERYDRIHTGEAVQRIHQEDFCQALRVLPSKKYQDDGGPDLRRMVDLVSRVSSDAAADVLRLVQWELLNVLMGNSDGHAKNVALLYGEQHRMAPVYDLICTDAYDFPKRLGQSIGGEYRPNYITGEHWNREFEHLGLNVKLYRDHLGEFASRVRDAVRATDEWLRGQGYWDEATERIGTLVEERGDTFEGGGIA
jgi:serine/threonine-protein kinase HipA